MHVGGIDFSSGKFGGLDIVNRPATSLPQELATAISQINDGIVGATYEPIWYVGKQLVNGVNYTFICKQVRATREIHTRIITLTLNIPPVTTTDPERKAKIVSISSEVNLPDEVAPLFDVITKNLVGVNYRPIAYVGSQVVKGTNYHIICQARAIYPNSEPYAVKMVINEFQGAASLVEIERIG